jgi:FKBP-type peptidyl-prolyl cis-trans isomerase FkpA
MKVLRLLVFSAALSLLSCNDDTNTFDVIKQFNADVNTIDNHIASTGTEAIKDNSGVRIVVTVLGTSSLPPRRDHTVNLKLNGRLLSSGVVIEDITKQGALSGLMPGLVEGVEILPEGSVATIYIPSALAYGNIEQPGIPANSILVYDVELLDVSIPQTEEQQFAADTIAINKHLKDNSIIALSTPFGVRYTITEEGSGSIPGWYARISVTYRASLLGSSEAFFNGTVEPSADFDSRVVDFLPGLQVAFQRFPPGTKAVVYIPSTMAFGKQGAGQGTVPPNSNVVYEITSFSVFN